MDTSTFMAIPAPTPSTPFVPPDFDVREGRLGRSTAFFSIATAFSRVAGLVREIVAASYFGISGPMSAFTIAFQVPNLVRSLFADAAIQAAFVPVFTELRKRKFSRRSRSERAIRFFCDAMLAMKRPARRAAKRIEQ